MEGQVKGSSGGSEISLNAFQCSSWIGECVEQVVKF
jgi:hypothetical protein